MILSRRVRPVISDENLAPVVQIITWLLLTFIILSAGTRFTTKAVVTRRFRDWDDILALLSVIFAIIQSICVILSTDNGLGRPLQSLSVPQLNSALKAQLAAEVFFLLSLWASKTSVLVFLYALTPLKKHRRILRIVCVLLSLWILSGFFSVVFQCDIPNTYNYIHGQCFNRMGFAWSMASLNIVSELALIVLPVVIILPLKTSLTRRLNLIACFLARILVIGATIGQLVELAQFSKRSDAILDVWPHLICTQCVQALSIITACLPYLKPFLESLQAGALRTENAEMRVHASTIAQGTKPATAQHPYVEIVRQPIPLGEDEENRSSTVSHATTTPIRDQP